HAILSVTFVSRPRIARINREHLGHAGSTDVITFALGRPNQVAAAPLVGDVYIATDVVREQARRFRVTAREELSRVVVHAMLHTLGRTHPTDESRTRSAMWRRQEALLRDAKRTGVL